MEKHVCVISLALPIEIDPRTSRQVEYLAQQYHVTLIGFGKPSDHWKHITWKPIHHHVSRIRLATEIVLLFLGRFLPPLYDFWLNTRPRYRQALQYAVESCADIFHASDWATLYVAYEAAHRTDALVVFDGDEYWPLENETNRLWRMFFAPLIHYTLGKYAHEIHAATTVSNQIAERYLKEYGIHATIILNVPDYQDVSYHTTNSDSIRLIHHGAARRNRYLETMIDALGKLDNRFQLVFMLVGGETGEDTGYPDQLKQYATAVAPGRVEFRPPVHPFEIVQTIADCDIGLCLIPPTTFTYRMTLPNKLFEFINAGLAVVTGPSPAMAEIVQDYSVGWIAAGFQATDLAEKLNALTAEQIRAARANAREAAKVLNAEAEYSKLLKLYQNLFVSHI